MKDYSANKLIAIIISIEIAVIIALGCIYLLTFY